MARTVAGLPAGIRITGFINVGAFTKTFALTKIHWVLAATEKASDRQRDLPAHVVIYNVMALALYMQAFYPEVFRGLLEGIEWLLPPPKGWGQLHQAKVKAVPHMKVSPFFCGGLAEPEFGG